MSDAQKSKREHIIPETPVGQQFVADTSGIFSTPRNVRTDAGDMANDSARKIVAQNMNNEMLECDMPVFFKEYGASEVPPNLVTLCKSHLMDEGYILDNNSWKDFQIPPSQTRETENNCYKPLGRIIKEIFDYALTTGKRKNKFVFKMVPNDYLKADISGTNHEMDACVVEEDQTEGEDEEDDDKKKGPIPNHTVIVSVEGKKGNKPDDTKQVREQLVGDCHHILCDDPRRMFIYGVTIVSRRMTAWYFSRSHSVKGMSFDWLRDDGINTFIQLMLSFALATPEGLGIDPHVHKAPVFHNEEGQQYIYEFDLPLSAGSEPLPAPLRELRSDANRKAKEDDAAKHGRKKMYFRTVNILSPERPLCITGRVTRIWTVRQVASINANRYLSEEKVILKDVWIDSEERTEVKSLTEIFMAVDKFVENAEKKYPGPDGLTRFMDSEPRFQDFDDITKERLQNLLTKKNYRSLFLTTLYACDGKKTKPLSTNTRTPKDPLFVNGTKYVQGGTQSRTVQGSANPTQRTMGTRDSPVGALVDARGPRGYVQKTQRRFIYKEVCVPSYKLPTFGHAMDIIRQTLDAVQILYCAGWVHRDISAGNVLAMEVKANGETHYKVKLSDFEFAQPIGTMTHRSDPRTGTPFFMPVEIMDRQYLLDTIRNYTEHPSSSQQPDEVAAYLANLRKRKVKQTVPAESSKPVLPWGIRPEHPLFEKLKEFKESPELLPVPSNATLDIPTYGTVVNYNYQHDLESIWWMILYFITTLANYPPSHAFGETWFTHNLNAAKRKDCLTYDIPPTFQPALKPEFQSIFPGIIEDMRKALLNQYIVRALYGRLKDESSYSFIHGKFARLLDGIIDSTPITNWASLEVKKIVGIPGVKVSLSVSASGQTSKRAAEGDAPGPSTSKKQRV